MIDVNEVSFSYNEDSDPVLRNISFTIENGSFVAVLGNNGSGKSTLAKMLNALLVPASGTVSVDGMNTADDENTWEIRKRVGMIFQNPDNQIIATSVMDDIAFGLENLGIPSEQMPSRIQDALRAVNMEEYADKAPHNLSGGQKQRVAIAGVLVMEPEVIICDEATAMLDPQGRQEVFRAVKNLNREKKISVVWITHFMEEALQCDRVLLMENGRLIGDGKPEELFSDANLIHGKKLALPYIAGLSDALRERGIDFPVCLTIEAFAQEVKRQCKSN